MAGLYIHIPFCSSKCRYCDFFSRVVNNEDSKSAYVAALCKEIELQKNYLGTKNINSVYFGGGTPSLLSIKQLNDIFTAIFKYFNLSENNEITLETNPEDLTKDFLHDLKKFTPVNRLSIGLQSFTDEELQFMNRKHSANTSLQAIKNAKSAGFSNITGDLIFALPNQTLDTWKYNLETFFSLDIPHLSAYNLTIEEDTVFGLWKRKNKIKEVKDDLSLKMYEILIETAKKNDFFHYEISNFAKKGYIAKHNFSYWTGEKYLGIGASAHSFNRNSRQWNIANINKYIEKIHKNIIPAEKEILTDNDKFNELIITGLRTYKGININKLKAYNSVYYNQISSIIKKYIDDNFLQKTDNHLILTKQGKFISDAIMSELLIID